MLINRGTMMIKKLLLCSCLIAFLITVAGCSNDTDLNKNVKSSSTSAQQIIADSTDDYELVYNINYEGTILKNPEYSSCDWVPDRKIIKEFEEGLQEYFEELWKEQYILNDRRCRYYLAYVDFHIREYKRQYIGQYINDKKILFVNFLTLSDDMKNNWYKGQIEVLDGGEKYVHVFYDVEAKEYYGLAVSGLGIDRYHGD